MAAQKQLPEEFKKALLEAPFFGELTEAHKLEILDQLKAGDQSFAEIFGFDVSGIRLIEDIAQSLYNAGQYLDACDAFAFITLMDHEYGPAWRALGAGNQASKQYEKAILAYDRAIEVMPGDIMSLVCLGECCCMLGRSTDGMEVLKRAVEQAPKTPLDEVYILRAKALLNSDGGFPPRVVLIQSSEEMVKNIAQDMKDKGLEFDAGSNLSLEDMEQLPALEGVLDQLNSAFMDGRITMQEIADLSDEELDAGYRVACNYVELKKYQAAMMVCAYLLLLKPDEARYYQLVGICYQRLKLYPLAVGYYDIARKLDPNDAMTHAYKAECLMYQNRNDAADASLKQARAVLSNHPDSHQLSKRIEGLEAIRSAAI
ncbi:MAG: hypothetical protein VYA34_05855 [Myxococcota bacterium]|nr:hypothetical protein [Myxococcota bacterium]